MPRPRKTGLDYFPFDCDFFEDEKIIAIAGEFGIKGELAAIKLLCAIYRNGYFIEWTEMLKLKMLQKMPGVSSELFEQILNRLVRWGFFDASLFDSVRVLTSVGIQRRYFNILKRCKKGENYPYLLVNVTETPVNVTETPQSKVNKRKVKRSTEVDTKSTASQGKLDLNFEEGKKAKRKLRKDNSATSPTLDEVFDYFLSQNADMRLENWEESAKRFFDYFNAVDWRDKFNRRITRWDSRANSWILDDEKRNKEKSKNEQPGATTSCAPSSGIPIRGKFTPGCGLKRSYAARET